jgi:hypothetical protein
VHFVLEEDCSEISDQFEECVGLEFEGWFVKGVRDKVDAGGQLEEMA